MCLEQVSWPEPNEKNEIHSDWSVFEIVLHYKNLC